MDLRTGFNPAFSGGVAPQQKAGPVLRTANAQDVSDIRFGSEKKTDKAAPSKKTSKDATPAEDKPRGFFATLLYYLATPFRWLAKLKDAFFGKAEGAAGAKKAKKTDITVEEENPPATYITRKKRSLVFHFDQVRKIFMQAVGNRAEREKFREANGKKVFTEAANYALGLIQGTSDALKQGKEVVNFGAEKTKPTKLLNGLIINLARPEAKRDKAKVLEFLDILIKDEIPYQKSLELDVDDSKSADE